MGASTDCDTDTMRLNDIGTGLLPPQLQKQDYAPPPPAMPDAKDAAATGGQAAEAAPAAAAAPRRRQRQGARRNSNWKGPQRTGTE